MQSPLFHYRTSKSPPNTSRGCNFVRLFIYPSFYYLHAQTHAPKRTHAHTEVRTETHVRARPGGGSSAAPPSVSLHLPAVTSSISRSRCQQGCGPRVLLCVDHVRECHHRRTDTRFLPPSFPLLFCTKLLFVPLHFFFIEGRRKEGGARF